LTNDVFGGKTHYVFLSHVDYFNEVIDDSNTSYANQASTGGNVQSRQC